MWSCGALLAGCSRNRTVERGMYRSRKGLEETGGEPGKILQIGRKRKITVMRQQSGCPTPLLEMKTMIYPSEGGGEPMNSRPGAGSSGNSSERNYTARHPHEGNENKGKLEDNGLDAGRGRRGHCELAGDSRGGPGPN